MKLKNVVIILLVALFISSCASFSKPLSSDKSFPADGRYEILGPVTHTEKQKIILGLFWSGGTGYSALYAQARGRYRADDVVSVSTDVHTFSVLGIYTEIIYTLRGIAIRYADPVRANP